MIIDKFVNKNITNRNIIYFKNLGYKDIKSGDIIKILIEHLTKGSHTKIRVRCDAEECNNEKELDYKMYLKNINKYNIYTCSVECSHKKIKKDILEKYGINENISKTEMTNIKKYGVKYPIQLKEIQEKSSKTKDERYGDPNYNNVEKREQTKLKKYGDPNYTNKEKIKETHNNKSEEEIQKALKKQENTKEVKYGEPHYNNLEKYEQTMLEKHGIPHNWSGTFGERTCDKTKEIKYGDPYYNNPEKSKQTMLKKYGVGHYSQTDEYTIKVNKTNLENYGVKWSFQSENNKTKSKQTLLKNYGVEHPAQSAVIYKRVLSSLYSTKEYILPSGRIVKVQGYENICLDLLLKTYKEEDLLINGEDIEKKIGQIWYIKEDGKKSRYLPDIYIISENKIIEVKSTWTYKKDKNNNLLKKQACLNMNMKFEFMVFNGKKQLLTESEVKNL